MSTGDDLKQHLRWDLDQLWGWAKSGKTTDGKGGRYYLMDVTNVDSFTDHVLRIVTGHGPMTQKLGGQLALAVRARSGIENKGLPLYRHCCGHVEALDEAPDHGGCDACESGSDDPGCWQPLWILSAGGSFTAIGVP